MDSSNSALQFSTIVWQDPVSPGLQTELAINRRHLIRSLDDGACWTPQAADQSLLSPVFFNV
jgi:hypothetical protein